MKAKPKAVELIKKNNGPLLVDKQNRILDELDGKAAIKIALSEENPHQFWKTIMDALQTIKNHELLDEALIKDLKQKAWLVTRNGKSTPPNDILYIKGVLYEA